MEKAWLKSYPPGVPEFINVDAYQSVAEVFDQAVEKYGDRPAFTNMGTTLSYSDIDLLTEQLGAYLQNLHNMILSISVF